MINNGKILKRKRYLCAFICVAMLSTIFACWANVAGQEEIPGNSDINTEAAEVVEVTAAEETVEAAEDATEGPVTAEESGEVDIADILESIVPVDHKLAVSAASYDDVTGILSVDIENTSDKDIEAVILLTDANYETDSIPCGYAQTVIGAGDTFTLSVEYAHGSEEAPVIGVKAQYAETVTSVSKEQYTNGTVGPFLGSGFVSYESMKELDVEDVLSMEESGKAENVTVDETPVKVSAATTYDSKSKELTIKLSLVNTALTDRVVDADVAIGDKNYELSDIAVRAGNAYEIEYVLENVEKDAKLPEVKVSGTYSDAVTSAKLGADGGIIAPTVYTIADADKNRIDTEIITAGEAVENFVLQTGFVRLFTTEWKCLIMIGIACVLLFLAIVKGFEPLLLLPIAFGMLLTNLPGAEMFHEALWAGGHAHWNLFDASNGVTPGLLDYLYLGVKLGIYPCLIFFGVGAMTDFEPLIANPKSLLLGAAAQLGIFVTFVAAKYLGFNDLEASSIGIIGGADGPTAIFVTSKLAPHLLGPIAVAAYSYMALVPVIQPPIMKLLTTKKERSIKMQALRKVSKAEKIIFPIVVSVFVALLVPSAAPLVGCLMLGNLFKESGVTERLSKTVQNELMNIVTIFLGVTVGATATAETFLSLQTIKIIIMGVIAFGLGTAGGVLLAKLMNLFLKNKINPLCGSAGVSAVPMAARVSQMVGQKEDPSNFLLMHAMGPNVAGVIGSAIAAGVLIALFG